MAGRDLLGGPDPVLLPPNAEAERELAAGSSAAEVAAHHPTFSGAWAALAEEALGRTERALGSSASRRRRSKLTARLWGASGRAC